MAERKRHASSSSSLKIPRFMRNWAIAFGCFMLGLLLSPYWQLSASTSMGSHSSSAYAGAGRSKTATRCRSSRHGTSVAEGKEDDASGYLGPWGPEARVSAYLPPLMNPVTPAFEYMHHPVILRFPPVPYPFEEGYIREFTGMRVAYDFDCVAGRDAGGFAYNDVCLSRVHKCAEHERLSARSAKEYVPERPIVDDEYAQWIAIIDALEEVKEGGRFVHVELGARWGTWVSRAAFLAKHLRPDVTFRGVAVEASKVYVDNMREHLKVNGLSDAVKVIHGFATPALMLDIIAQEGPIDVIDMDVQGAEFQIVTDTAFLRAARESVRYMFIGTHDGHADPNPSLWLKLKMLLGVVGSDVHEPLLRVLREAGWLILENDRPGISPSCDALVKERRVQELFTRGCTGVSQFGPVYTRDGGITVTRP